MFLDAPPNTIGRRRDIYRVLLTQIRTPWRLGSWAALAGGWSTPPSCAPPVFMIFPLRCPMFLRKRALRISARESLCIIIDEMLCTLHVLIEFRSLILGGELLDVPCEKHPPPLLAPLISSTCTMNVAMLVAHVFFF